MYELFKSEKTGKFHFRLKAGNGEIILQSQAYADKNGA
ncbi:MAG: YegP family protein, partial [Akkermansiaceae bacterium]